jgi:hypothetical protein
MDSTAHGLYGAWSDTARLTGTEGRRARRGVALPSSSLDLLNSVFGFQDHLVRNHSILHLKLIESIWFESRIL